MKQKTLITILVLALAAIVAAVVLAACASGGGTSGGSSPSGGLRLVFREIPAVTKAAFDTLDPVFQSNLKPNAAIVVFPVSTDDMDDSEGIYEQLQINIVNSNRYTIVEKRNVDQLLAEHDFQQSGLVSEAATVDFGKLLGADAVLLGAVTGRGSDRELSLIAVDMQNRKTLAVAR